MVDIFSKYAAILYSFIKAPLTKHKGSGSGNVLIIEGGHIGDVIMDASALIYLAEHYVKAGKNVYFLCSPPLWDMLKRISNMNGVQYVGNDYSYDSRHQHYDSFWKSFAQLKEKNYELIISIQNADLRIHCMVACLTASEKWGVITQSNSHGIRGCVKSLLLKCYTNIVWGDRRKFQLRRMEQLVRELQIGDYHAQNVFIPPQQDALTKSKSYIAIAVDSAVASRRWPAQNFVLLISRLLADCSDDIYLIGSGMDCDLQDRITKTFGQEHHRIKNLVGKTSIEEWIEIIRGSQFLIGVDSGSIHVAAAVGTVAFCLVGVWSSHRFMPYDVDVIAPGTILPVCIYRRDVDVEKMPCYNCISRGRFGQGNAECYKLCKSGQPCLCLSKITPDDVMAVIEQRFPMLID